MSFSRRVGLILISISSFTWLTAHAGTNDPLAYLEENDPFYVHLGFPKLTTPQWVGETGVEAVVILAIDDLRSPEKYETVLRPIIERLKQIDGRAPVSILCNALTPDHPQFQVWLREGLSLEVHTLSHPCPLLAKGDFAAAEQTYHGGIELLQRIPGNRPVAFRMPCCDSMNSPSPRFYAELFNSTNAAGQFLTIDSSVMNILTSRDPVLPRELVRDDDGRDKFSKYLPAATNASTRVSMGSFVTTIEDYPYPYVINRLCWEFPAMVPSDWEAQNIHGSNNPQTVADWKAALDATVIKQGTFSYIFHPHGWIRPEQMVEFIDYALTKYGSKVKFLSFREASERLERHLLAGHPLRAINGQDNGVRLVDVNHDGYLDVISAGPGRKWTRVWQPRQRTWQQTEFPVTLVERNSKGDLAETGVKFGAFRSNNRVSILIRTESMQGAWTFDDDTWREDVALLAGLELEGRPVLTRREGRDQGVRCRTLDTEQSSKIIVANPAQSALFKWSAHEAKWRKADYALPAGLIAVDGAGRDAGLRFVDLDEDGFEDVIFSDAQRYAIHLFVSNPRDHLGLGLGWSHKVHGGVRSDPSAIPSIVRGGDHPNNGAWFRRRHLWVQNEDTAHLPDKVDRRSFASLLAFDAPPPLSPEEALRSFELRPGFQIELVASEPLVTDPVAFEWGADGKLWIAEMSDYPSGLDGHGKPGGLVRFLEDTNRDGRYDRSTVFLENLNFPNGIMPWRKGILVSAAPEIFYAEDTDGDGKADLRQPLVSGFNEGNQQHRVNGFDYGLDNWVYAANGDSGGLIRRVGRVPSALKPGDPLASPLDSGRGALNLRGHDLRFQPDGGALELIAGQTQFGRHRDDWGNWFGNNNPAWLWHYWIEERYVARNPHLAIKSTKQYLANQANSTRAYAISRPMQRFNWLDMVNTVTSANSATPYRDTLFGPDFATSVFISEPANSLIHREVLTSDGISFTSRRSADEEDREFLASRDNWFRPTMLKIGPDGALYIADMYRLVIEHPEYALPGIEKHINVRAGDDRGHIYRVYPTNVTLHPIPRLDGLATRDLVARLDSPNGWQRDTAQRLLVHGNDPAAVAPLEELALNSKRAMARLHALYTLHGFGRLTPPLLTQVLAARDLTPGLRQHAIRLSEPFLANSSDANAAARIKLKETLATLHDDPELGVRYQLALTIGEWPDYVAGETLAKLAGKDGANTKFQAAVMSSAPRHLRTLLNVLAGENTEAAHALIESLLGLAVTLGDDDVVAVTLGRIPGAKSRGATWQFRTIVAVLDAVERRGKTWPAYVLKLTEKPQPDDLRLSVLLDAWFLNARRVAADNEASENSRLAALGLLGRGMLRQDEDIDRLTELMAPQQPTAIQQGALKALSRLSAENVGTALVTHWPAYSPSIRMAAMNTFLIRRPWTQQLLTAIERQQIPAGQLGASVQRSLLENADSTIRERASKLFARANPDRQKVLEAYANISRLRGDASRGADLFRQNCATCHRFRNEGASLGPDLATLTDRSTATMLVAILDPNRSVEAPFVGYTALTKDGRELSGVIAAETAHSVTVRGAGAVEEVILRSDLKELSGSGLSLMPEGLENALDLQAMADLLEFLRSS